MKILAIDGNSIMNRAFYGIKMLSNSKGLYTNALTGFMNIYLKEIDAVHPDSVAVAFDLKAPTFRHKAVSTYKANRKGMPDELAQQMPVIKEILTAMGLNVIETEGYEADDILGTLSKIFSSDDNECVILTGDRDSLQLINDKVTVRLATNKETVVFTPDKFNEVYEITPAEFIDIKALMGDSSDNISGVAGIGEKTAFSLIKAYHNLESLYENLETAGLTKSVTEKLIKGKDDAYQSRWLATIATDIPLPAGNEPENYKNSPADTEKLSEILSDMEMFRLKERLLSGIKLADTLPAEPKIKLVNLTKYEACEFTDESFNALSGVTYFIFSDTTLNLFCSDKIYYTENTELILKYFTSEFEKKCFDAKPAYKLCFENNIELKNITFCCDLAGYLLNSQAADYNIKDLCDCYKTAYRTDIEGFESIATLPALCVRLEAEIKKTDMDNLLYNIEQPLCEVLASMEVVGVKADINGIKEFGVNLTAGIEQTEAKIYELAGKEFNISSPKQLGVILFEELGLPCKKKTKSGYSTNADVLEDLSDKHPIIPLILEYRTLAKLNSTYVDGLLKVVRDDGRIHSVFKQTETRTGRISSTEPNVQNIPVRKELGRNMRKFFIAESGKTLLDADYSQIELRVLASVCGDENMQEIFRNGGDIHASTASQVFNLPLDFVTPEMRSAAKAVNFGIVYGIGPFSLSKDIGVSVAQAKQYIANYLANFPNVQKFMDKTVEDGIKNGYVTTYFGRRRYIPELNASNKMLQAFGKRAAMNAPVQGAAADIIKIAMVAVYRRLKEEKLNAKLILQVHDELIIEASENDAEKASSILKDAMENAVSLAVPMTVDVNSGYSWYAAKG